ncbi:exporter protein [Azospirillum sp. B510]|uniref:LysE family translocator n=1 Tax=Azospirillum sp. (strain B510) TaxID=137722 RepID=UPI0001C4C3C3|nr:LysE family transporter [Azospirillum sp. B510]BAI70952.1 exporter protein [Azospirillum sp. B510]
MEQAVLIVSIVWLAVLSPGADFAMVSRNSCLYGRRAGLAVSVGIAMACWFHIAYAIFGIAIIQKVFPEALDVIKLLGTAYLIYMGASTALSRVVATGAIGAAGAAGESAGHAGRSGARGIFTGVLTNGLNPKTSIFVISLYSQVIGRETPVSQQFAWGLFISLSHFLWFSLVSIWLSRPEVRAFVMRRQRIFNVAIGAILTTFGILLLAFEQGGSIG